MTPDPVQSYRSALRAELLEAGPAALEMCAGQRPVDPVILLSAWKAAGLLPVSASAEERALREQLLALSPELPELTWPTLLAAPDDQEEQLYELVALMGLAAAIPAVRPQAEKLLEEFSLALALEDPPKHIQDLAAFLEDALDLDDQHYAARLLQDFSRPLPELALTRAAVERGIAAAREKVYSGSFWSWLRDAGGRLSTEIKRWLEDHTPLPSLAFAASEDGPRLHDRLRIHSAPEVCLMRLGEELVLEVDGSDTPVPRAAGQSLEELPPLVEGTRLWRLPATVPNQLQLGEQILRLDS